MKNVPRLTALELQNAELKEIIKLAKKAIDLGETPDCCCEWHHGWCDARKWGDACHQFEEKAASVLGEKWFED